MNSYELDNIRWHPKHDTICWHSHVYRDIDIKILEKYEDPEFMAEIQRACLSVSLWKMD